MSPPQRGHCHGTASPTRASDFASPSVMNPRRHAKNIDRSPGDAVLDARPDPLKSIPQLRPRTADAEVHDARIRGGVRLDETADVTVEGDQDSIFALAHRDQIGISRFRRSGGRLDHNMPLLSKPCDDQAIDVFIGAYPHRHAAE